MYRRPTFRASRDNFLQTLLGGREKVNVSNRVTGEYPRATLGLLSADGRSLKTQLVSRTRSRSVHALAFDTDSTPTYAMASDQAIRNVRLVYDTNIVAVV